MPGHYVRRGYKVLSDKGPIEFVKNLSDFFILKQREKKIDWKYDTANGPDEISVDPENIKYYLIEGDHPATSHRHSKGYASPHKLEKAYFKPHLFRGKVLDGDWDIHKEKYEFDRYYRAVKNVFIDGKDWDNIHFGQRSLLKEKIRGSDHSKNIQRIESLYKSIDKQGYMKSKGGSPIRINIGRNGELIFNNKDGHTRVAIAKITDVNKIPAQVIVRHKQWQKLRNDVYRNGLSKETKKLRDHPDLQDILN